MRFSRVLTASGVPDPAGERLTDEVVARRQRIGSALARVAGEAVQRQVVCVERDLREAADRRSDTAPRRRACAARSPARRG